MIAILYCRGLPVEQLHGKSRERAIDDANLMLAGLTDIQRRDWSLVIIIEGNRPERLFGPKV